MPTPIIQRGLELFTEANELPGADGSNVTAWNDLTANGRNFAGTSTYPVIKTNAVNSKKSVYWNGSKNPLVAPFAFTIRCGFLIAKITALFSDYSGLLSGTTANPVLVGAPSSSNWFDNKYEWYEYRLNDRIANYVDSWANGQSSRVLSAPAPVGSFGIIFFKFWNNLSLTDLQIGKDRDFVGRLLTGEVALLALYSRDLDQSEIRLNTESLAYSYNISIADKFPARGSKGDTHTIGKQIVTDGQPEPNVRVKSNLRNSFDASFSVRSMAELRKVQAFYNAKYPEKNFLFTDCNLVPPEDYAVKFATQNIPFGENLNTSDYPVVFTETTGAVDYYVPSNAPTINY